MSERIDDGRQEGGCTCGRHGSAGPSPGAAERRERPAWASATAATHTLDARPMLAAGEHPVGQVLALLGTLQGEEVLQLLTPFVPEPLVDRASGGGFVAYSAVEAPGLVRTFFRRGQA